MSCERVAPELSAFVDDALAGEERAAVAAHLGECSVCRAEVEALQLVAGQLQGLPRLTAPGHFTAQVMAGVVELAPPRAPAAASPGEAEPCPPGDQLTAAIDGVLQAEEAERLAAHLEACRACRAEREGLEGLRAFLARLPRLTAPADFAARVMAAIWREEREAEVRARQAREVRASWWRRAGLFAQAASFFFLVGAGAWLTTPGSEWFAPYTAHRGGSRAPQERWEKPARSVERSGRHVAADAAPEPGAAGAPLHEGPYDALIEVEASGELDAAAAAAGRAVTRFGRQVEGSLRGEAFQGYVVRVPANLADDLLAELDRDEALRVDQPDRDAVGRTATELDQVVLKSGYAFVGRVEEVRGEVLVRTPEVVIRFPRQDVERVERATDLRRLRLEVRK